MRQQALVLFVVIGIASATGTLCSTVASAATTHSETSHTATSQQPVTAQSIIATAEQYLGAKYASVGDSPVTGFSCIGFVYYIYTLRNNVPVGQDLESAYAEAPHVGRADLIPGDLVFFQGTVPGMTPLSHVGIYIGGDRMIAADSFQTGVEYDNLNDTYWTAHYVGATRPLAVMGLAPEPAPVPSSDIVTATATTPTSTGAISVTLDTATQGPAQPMAPPGASLIAQQSNVIIRSGPGDQYMELTTVSSGTKMVVQHSDGAWYQVAIGDQFGWVPANAVLVDPASTGQDAAAVITPTPTTQTPSTATAQASATTVPTTDAGTASGSATAQKMAVSAGVLKMHDAPSRTANTVAQLTFGTVVSVLQTQGEWDRVARGDGTSGWVFNQYLSPNLNLGTTGKSLRPSTEVAGFRATSTYHIVIVTASILVVRSSPSTTAPAITQVKSGDQLRVVRTQPGWLYVTMRGGQSGWVSAQWVRDQTG